MEPANHLRPRSAISPAIPPEVEPLPAPGEVHLWRADLDSYEPDPACLSQDERDRAARFRTPGLSRRFAAGRSFLRRTLAAYLACAPASLAFTYNPYGRPALAEAAFDFNLSHCENQAVLAVALDGVGVDLERRRPDADLPDMARQVMSPQELRAFEALSDHDRLIAFYDLWTAKEAVIKALGTGFSRDARTLHIGWDAQPRFAENGRVHQIRRFTLEQDLPGAVAVEAEIQALMLRPASPAGCAGR